MIENSAGWRYVQSSDPLADYPTVSEHNAGKFQDLKSVVAGKAPLTHTHTQSQVTGLDSALAGKAPLTHTHPQSQVTGLDTALAGKAPVSHTHPQSQVTGLDTALAGKAPVSHTHPQSQVTGLDAALAGKAPLATLNTRVPENLALRLDTTVGTRIFAGSTMIYGDTGWRDCESLLSPNFQLWGPTGPATTPSANTFMRMKREGSVVELSARIGASSASAGLPRSTVLNLLAAIPTNFAPHRDNILCGTFWSYTSGSTGVMRITVSNVEVRNGTGTWADNELILIQARWITNSTWPTSLPGTPA